MKIDHSILYKTQKQKNYYENLSDLYSILNTTEQLEKAYIRDSISSSKYLFKSNNGYELHCSKLIAHFKTALNLVEFDHDKVKNFVEEFDVYIFFYNFFIAELPFSLK